MSRRSAASKSNSRRSKAALSSSNASSNNNNNNNNASKNNGTNGPTSSDGLPASVQQDHSQSHRQFLIRSLERNDKEIAVLMDLNKSLHKARKDVIDTCGELVLLDIGRGRLQLLNDELHQQESTNNDNDNDNTNDNENDNEIHHRLTPQQKKVCVDFLLRFKLRRKLCNRLIRRLNRLAHAMDGNEVAPPIPPKYGDLRLHMDPQKIQQAVQRWNQQAELKQSIHKKKQAQQQQQLLQRLYHVGFKRHQEQQQQQKAKEEQQQQQQQQSNDNDNSNNNNNTNEESKPTKIPEGAPSSATPTSTTTTSATIPAPSTPAAAAAAASSSLSTPSHDEIDMEALKEYDSAYEKVWDCKTNKFKYTLLDQPHQEDHHNIKYGAGIGATHRSMSIKEKQIEFQRWAASITNRIAHQPSFAELGLQNRVFAFAKRVHAALDEQMESPAKMQTTPPQQDEKQKQEQEQTEVAKDTSRDNSTDKDTKIKDGDDDDDDDDDDNNNKKNEDEDVVMDTTDQDEDDKTSKKLNFDNLKDDSNKDDSDGKADHDGDVEMRPASNDDEKERDDKEDNNDKNDDKDKNEEMTDEEDKNNKATPEATKTEADAEGSNDDDKGNEDMSTQDKNQSDDASTAETKGEDSSAADANQDSKTKENENERHTETATATATDVPIKTVDIGSEKPKDEEDNDKGKNETKSEDNSTKNDSDDNEEDDDDESDLFAVDDDDDNQESNHDDDKNDQELKPTMDGENATDDMVVDETPKKGNQTKKNDKDSKELNGDEPTEKTKDDNEEDGSEEGEEEDDEDGSEKGTNATKKMDTDDSDDKATDEEEDDEDDGGEEEDNDDGDDDEEDDNEDESKDGNKTTGPKITPKQKEDKKQPPKEEVDLLPPKPTKPLSLVPVPSFYEQDLRRIRMIHRDLMAASIVEQGRKQLATFTSEYNNAFHASNDLYDNLRALTARLDTLRQTRAAKMAEIKKQYDKQVTAAREQWRKNKQKHDIKRAKHAMPSNWGRQPIGTNITQGYCRNGGMYNVIGTCMADIVDATIMQIDGNFPESKYKEFVPPPPPDVANQIADHNTGETFLEQQQRREAELTNQIAECKAQFTTSEQERHKAWKKVLKARAEYDGKGRTNNSNNNNNQYYAQQMSLPLPPLRTSAKQTVPQEVKTAQTSVGSYKPPTSVRRTTGGAGGSNRTTGIAAVASSSSATTGVSESKYSAARVRERIGADGTVAPVSEPKKAKDGLYQRPAGRTRKGMQWDALRGIWVPEESNNNSANTNNGQRR